MSSEYAQAGPFSVERAGRKSFRGRKGERSISPPEEGLAATPAAVLVEETSRFRPGALSPVGEQSGKSGAGVGKLPTKPARLLDRLLLAAEIASALVVVWLVAQYIYTAYFDTAPRRVSPSVARAVPTRTPTRPTATPTSTATAEDEQEAWTFKSGGNRHNSIAKPTWTPTGTPTLTSTPAIDPALLLPSRLRIPVMFLDSPVHEVKVNMGTWEVAPMDIGHHEGSANPGETGNVVLAGHRDINSALFRELDRLKPGDEVFVSNGLREYRYIVKESFVVGPGHTEVMDPTDDKRVTLITCTPIGLATQRLIVTAILDEQTGTR